MEKNLYQKPLKMSSQIALPWLGFMSAFELISVTKEMG